MYWGKQDKSHVSQVSVVSEWVYNLIFSFLLTRIKKLKTYLTEGNTYQIRQMMWLIQIGASKDWPKSLHAEKAKVPGHRKACQWGRWCKCPRRMLVMVSTLRWLLCRRLDGLQHHQQRSLLPCRVCLHQTLGISALSRNVNKAQNRN